MVLCLMVLGVLGVMSLWVLKTAFLNRLIAHNQVRQVQSFYLAESGLKIAVAGIQGNPLWRGEDFEAWPAATGELSLTGLKGTYAVTVYDATNDGNGRWDSRLPGGVLRIVSEGSLATSFQELSCSVRLTPSAAHAAHSPKIAVISSGDIALSGGAVPVMGFDELGRPDAAMIQADAVLPEINPIALKSLADEAVDALDDEIFDTCFRTRERFWRDSPADTQPYITWVRGDLTISGNRRLQGIFFVEGEQVSLSGDATLHGVLYAPNARNIILPEGDLSTPQHPIMGQVLAGQGGVQGTGDCLGVQLVGEYVDAFNDASSSVVSASVIPGSWRQP
jgi:hypothetical protein